jgi:hypothetical protein
MKQMWRFLSREQVRRKKMRKCRWKLFKLGMKVIPSLFTLDTHKLTRFSIFGFVMFAERWTRKSTTSRVKKEKKLKYKRKTKHTQTHNFKPELRPFFFEEKFQPKKKTKNVQIDCERVIDRCCWWPCLLPEVHRPAPMTY